MSSLNIPAERRRFLDWIFFLNLPLLLTNYNTLESYLIFMTHSLIIYYRKATKLITSGSRLLLIYLYILSSLGKALAESCDYKKYIRTHPYASSPKTWFL